ncbi:hypothetical protein SKAU_G00111450 [Synaphobranchus kaupii]|uniref:Uncharacterized protein n=1 Tax=Synaphobranchus kaupii TaxID=118154 RepID=A0A9Q1J7D2_SYNKA|nr:hypothetical protein SKAU_G00111450 [Synaphobranchus kaupii]
MAQHRELNPANRRRPGQPARWRERRESAQSCELRLGGARRDRRQGSGTGKVSRANQESGLPVGRSQSSWRPKSTLRSSSSRAVEDESMRLRRSPLRSVLMLPPSALEPCQGWGAERGGALINISPIHAGQSPHLGTGPILCFLFQKVSIQPLPPHATRWCLSHLEPLPPLMRPAPAKGSLRGGRGGGVDPQTPPPSLLH